MASPRLLFVVLVLVCCCSGAHSSTWSGGSAVEVGASGREVARNGETGSTDVPKTSTVFPDEATPSHVMVTSTSKPHATVAGTTPDATNVTTPSNATDIHTTPSNTTHVHTTPNTTDVYTTAPNTTHVHTTPQNTTHVYTSAPNTTHAHTTPPNTTHVYTTTAPNTTHVHTTPPNTTHVYTTPPNTTHVYTTPNATNIYTTLPNTTHVHTAPPNTTLPNTTSSMKTTRIPTTSSADTTPPPTTNIHTTPHVPTTTFPGPTSGTWYVNQSGEPCLILQAAITVNITYSTSPTTAAAVLVSLPESAESSGSCGPNTSHITLGLQSGDFNLTFTFDANVTSNGVENAFILSGVSLGYVLDKARFPDSSAAGKPVLVQYSNFSNTHLSASMGSSLKCDSEQSFSLDRNHVLSISHVQVQPFSVKGGKFSKAETCPEDGKGSHYNLGVAVALCVTIPVIFMLVFIGWHYFCVMRKRGGGKAYSALI